jgi:hypothetical protein
MNPNVVASEPEDLARPHEPNVWLRGVSLFSAPNMVRL